MKTFVVTLTRTIKDINEESALEKFDYELKNQLYDSGSIEIEEVNESEG